MEIGWMEIGWALLLVVMLAMLLPRANQLLKDSPKGALADWGSFIIPIGFVVLFVLLLMYFV
jgi:hypothetical protein